MRVKRVRRKSPQLIRDPFITFGGGEHKAKVGETHTTAVHIKQLKRSWMSGRMVETIGTADGREKKNELCPGGPLNSKKNDNSIPR